MTAIERVRSLRETIQLAKFELGREVEKAWPVGGEIRWERGGHLQLGNVVSHSGARLRVKNMRTGNTLWISVYDIPGVSG